MPKIIIRKSEDKDRKEFYCECGCIFTASPKDYYPNSCYYYSECPECGEEAQGDRT